MKSSYALAVLAIFSLSVILAGCGGAADSGRPARNAALVVEPGLVDATNDFGFRLYRELALKDGSKNLFVSPASIELALAMTYNGAGTSTKTGMAAAMGLGSMSLEEVNEA